MAPVTGNTQVGTGSAAAPGALAVVASLTLPQGIYAIKLILALTATAETALRNYRLRRNNGAGGFTTIADNLPTLSGLALPPLEIDRVYMDTPSGGSLELISIAGATAGSIYNGVILATQLA